MHDAKQQEDLFTSRLRYPDLGSVPSDPGVEGA